eukprot:352860-Chlamydomonas_euryale.AAC.1
MLMLGSLSPPPPPPPPPPRPPPSSAGQAVPGRPDLLHDVFPTKSTSKVLPWGFVADGGTNTHISNDLKTGPAYNIYFLLGASISDRVVAP